MDPLLHGILTDLVSLISTIVAGLLVFLIKRSLGIVTMKKIQQELSTKTELAQLAVKYVEQVFGGALKGPEKFAKAIEWLTAQSNRLGITISQSEMQGLIEAALRDLKDTFGEDWGKVVQSSTPTDN